LVCPTSYRSSVTTRELANLGYDAYSLSGGIQAWFGFILSHFFFFLFSYFLFSRSHRNDPASCEFDFVCVLGKEIKELDGITMSLSIALSSLKNGNATALVLMSDSVFVGKKGEAEKLGKTNDPFRSVADLFKDFVEGGGLIFACRSCMKSRKLEFDEMEEGVNPASAPDIIRWISNAKGSINHT